MKVNYKKENKKNQMEDRKFNLAGTNHLENPTFLHFEGYGLQIHTYFEYNFLMLSP